MVTTVSLERLSMSNVRHHSGKVIYSSAAIDAETLQRIRQALAYIFEVF
jgi:hypothetical protein